MMVFIHWIEEILLLKEIEQTITVELYSDAYHATTYDSLVVYKASNNDTTSISTRGPTCVQQLAYSLVLGHTVL